jgi:hypothetical protein
VADVGETLVADTGPTPEAAPEPGGFAGVFGSPDA